MTNVVTAETAIALKNAGFPQPEFQTGQIWYFNGSVAFISTTFRLGIDVAIIEGRCLSRPQERAYWKHMNTAFAPTATDILRELGLGYGLYVSESGNVFICKELATIWRDENPAEACAKAWLANQK